MQYLRALAILLVAALVAVAGLQDKDKGKDKNEKIKGTLPANFKKLGLSDAQRQKIYKFMADYKAKLEELDKQKAKAKDERDEAIEKVLTPEQVKELKRIRTGEKDKPEKDKPEKAKPEKDKPEKDKKDK